MDFNNIYSRYKLDIKDDKIYDPIRNGYYKCTPEEIVRQKTIKFLTHRLCVPKSKIIVERTLNSLGVIDSKKRIDIGILDYDSLIMAVIECKSSLKKIMKVLTFKHTVILLICLQDIFLL